MLSTFTVRLSQITIKTGARTSDAAIDQVLAAEGAPFSAFRSVYLDDPLPDVATAYGAPMGRRGRPLDADGDWRAERVALDEGGYDKGGAYWGLRPAGTGLFVVQDGMGNIAFTDAVGPADAKARVAAPLD